MASEQAISTASEDVERLARHAGKLLRGTTLGDPVPATLRALAQERDTLEEDYSRCYATLRRAYAERDAARAEAARLREALIVVLQRAASPVGGWLDGERGETLQKIQSIARAALAQKEG
jgi:hypothetical protein